MIQNYLSKRLLTITGLLVIFYPLHSQESSFKTISGHIVDSKSGEDLPFVSVSLKKQHLGLLSNDEGRFDLIVPENGVEDTLLINYLGYQHQLIALKNIATNINIKLIESAIDLKEVEIRPWAADHYVRMAMRAIPKNYPKEPFVTEAYYLEKLLENKNVIRYDEGIFKTYYPNYLDTTKRQNQLLLYNRIDNPAEIEFMAKEKKKKQEKNKRKGKDTTHTSGVNIDLGESFGGPEAVLKSSDITKKSENFLDTTKLKSYRYEFAKSTTYNNSELMVIHFESKGKVDHTRESGKIYIDVASLAIVRIESAGTMVIPAYIKPILFLYGIGIDNPTYTSRTEYSQINGKWYPNYVQYFIEIHLINRHLFSPNEHSRFEIEQLFSVNKTKTNVNLPIPKEKRFVSTKDMKSQVHNDDNLKWEEINIIKH